MGFICKSFQTVANLKKVCPYIYWEKSMYKWIHSVQTYVVQGSAALTTVTMAKIGLKDN